VNDRPQADDTGLSTPFSELKPHEQEVVANIREHGFFAWSVGVGPRELKFAYTVGLWLNLGHPEVIVLGVAPEVAHTVFWNVWDLAKAQGSLPVGQPVEGIGPTPVYLMPVGHLARTDLMLSDRWFYRRDDFPAVQVVWPDDNDLFPWEDGFDPACRWLQPDLSEDGWRKVLGLPEPPPLPRRSLWDRLIGPGWKPPPADS
jgi:hypothetical protein